VPHKKPQQNLKILGKTVNAQKALHNSFYSIGGTSLVVMIAALRQAYKTPDSSNLSPDFQMINLAK